MRRALAAALAICAVTAASAQSRSGASREALAAIDACVPRLDPALDVGYERIAIRCPSLAASLERSGWAAWLPNGWKDARNELSAGSLAELRTLVQRELAAPAADGPRPSVAHLHEVLAELGPATRRNESLWTRFRAWLRSVVERNGQPEAGNWLDRMVQRTGRSQTFVELLTFACLGVVFLLSAVILVNELRAAGIIRSRTRGVPVAAAGATGSARRLGWSDIERASLAEKPGLLLQMVVSRLTEARRLPPAGSMTVRELNRSVKLDDAQDRERLAELARTAERVRYSGSVLSPQAIDVAVEQGRALLDRLAKRA